MSSLKRSLVIQRAFLDIFSKYQHSYNIVGMCNIECKRFSVSPHIINYRKDVVSQVTSLHMMHLKAATSNVYMLTVN